MGAFGLLLDKLERVGVVERPTPSRPGVAQAWEETSAGMDPPEALDPSHLCRRHAKPALNCISTNWVAESLDRYHGICTWLFLASFGAGTVRGDVPMQWQVRSQT